MARSNRDTSPIKGKGGETRAAVKAIRIETMDRNDSEGAGCTLTEEKSQPSVYHYLYKE